MEQDSLGDEKLESARQINRIMMDRSKDASLVITNLPPIIDERKNPREYLAFCSVMTEGIKRLLFIQNSSKEVLT